MFGRKKKKEEVVQRDSFGRRKPKLSELSPEEQEKALALLQKMGDDLVERYQRIMDERLERAKARLQGNTDARETEGFSPEADVSDTASEQSTGGKEDTQQKAEDNTEVSDAAVQELLESLALGEQPSEPQDTDPWELLRREMQAWEAASEANANAKTNDSDDKQS